jgi:hypothetical protein
LARLKGLGRHNNRFLSPALRKIDYFHIDQEQHKPLFEVGLALDISMDKEIGILFLIYLLPDRDLPLGFHPTTLLFSARGLQLGTAAIFAYFFTAISRAPRM